MREIKFKAWDINNNKMYLSKCVNEETGEWLVDIDYTNNCECSDKDRLIQMQYIGLKDSNNKEIYEGDIIKISFEEEESIHVVTYQANRDYPAFELEPNLDCESNGFSCIKAEIGYEFIVIGNIYENPELISEKSQYKGEK